MTVTSEYNLIKRIAKEFALPIKPCPDCLGDGEISVFNGGSTDNEVCPKCKGRGYRKRKKRDNGD